MDLRSTFRMAALALVAAAPMAAMAQATGSGAAPKKEVPAAPNLQLSTVGETPANTNPFPKPDPRNFSADSPTAATVDAFLKASWGYDPNRIWQVQGITKTIVPGLSRVYVLVSQRSAGAQIQPLQFFVLPDGKHLVADDVQAFGEHPYADSRKVLLDRAQGPSRGGASKDLLLVEFADFQCPHCKEAQDTVEKLLADFPNAHFVYENDPLTQIHSEAFKASAYSVCVAKTGGDDAFFKYSKAVYANQAALTPTGSDQALNDAATAAGVDTAKVAACSTTPEAKAAVDASLKLAEDLGVNSTPTLYVNGRALPLSAIQYDSLKALVNYQAQQDGPAPK